MNQQTKRIIQQIAGLLAVNGVDLKCGYGIESWFEDHMTHSDMRKALWDIKEHDVVTLTDDSFKDQGIFRGFQGTVVHVYSHDEELEVEFQPDEHDLMGTVKVLTLQKSQAILAP